MEVFTVIMLAGTTISALGIVAYVGIKSISGEHGFLVGKIYRFLYSVTFSVTTYVVSFVVLSNFDIKLGFTDITPAGVVSTILIYVGTSIFTKGTDVA